jgi:PAS domain S-box-containing protein
VNELTAYLESGQRRAEQELVRFFDLSLDLFGIAGLNGYFRRLNENFPRLLGYSADELKSRQFMDFVHPDDRETTSTEIGRLARGELTIQFLNRYRHADGHYVWLEWNARSVAEEAVIYAVARDVSERVTAAQERATLAAFTAASALFLTAEGGLRKRLHDVASEAVCQLDIAAVQIWGWDGLLSRLTLLTNAGAEVGPDGSPGGIAAGEGSVGRVALTKQPQHILDTHDAWREFDRDRDRMARHGIRSFVGYPLLVADRLVGVLAVYSVRPVSDLLITAFSSVVASMALAIRLDRRED